ncbi:hypothetical protein PHLCEN_2v7010 [Hermanssonia centrifuga]|uniref:Uncharacterized protein n=1 Tax=Hermanssonia centrifuga TaxID=98765 RepID=A0A2R6NXT6_9APHY|nr:hypothetical protein PHLCEN_2v7010 [Hermanssonia centrifuga]
MEEPYLRWKSENHEQNLQPPSPEPTVLKGRGLPDERGHVSASPGTFPTAGKREAGRAFCV